MAESKLAVASDIAQIVGLVPSGICCWIALNPSSSGGDPMIYPSALLVSFGAALSFFMLGGLLALVSFLKRKKGSPLTSPDPSIAEKIFDYRTEELKADQVQLYLLGSQISSMFTPTQVEALSIASDLKRFLDGLPEPIATDTTTMDAILAHSFGPRAVWQTKMKARYEDDFSPRLKRFLLDLRRDGQEDNILSRFENSIHDKDSIGIIRARLWAIAAFRDNIDFTGNL